MSNSEAKIKVDPSVLAQLNQVAGPETRSVKFSSGLVPPPAPKPESQTRTVPRAATR